ncbi:MAG: pantoate--beta-alanine ligase, partial [Acidiferrobacterales bacterium]|nr:pantoate--beta-alanine ligase [Acidiferrobacterales bacterium]
MANRHAPVSCGSLATMMLRLSDPDSAHRWCAEQRAGGKTLGFVPTMGALHPGHMELLRRARAENDVSCVSSFVNPLQFNDPKDLASYPRDFEKDARMLEEAGCDMIFTGTLEQFFPEIENPEQIVKRDPGRGAEGVEGAARPGHFAGVATICERLFKTVGPARAYFGEKDFQQTLVVEDLAQALGYPEIVVCPTVREPSGLAWSSRNYLLNEDERARGACLSQALFAARDAWRAGERDPANLRAVMLRELQVEGVELEYAELRDPEAWSPQRPPGPMT